MKFVFLMDPLGTVNFYKDTTLSFMQSAYRKGYSVYFLPGDGISLRDSEVFLRIQKVVPPLKSKDHFQVQTEKIVPAKDVDALLIRTDPPFDARYLLNTWILDQLPRNVVLLNSAHGIRTVNEKIWACRFSDLVPPTLISSYQDELNHFIRVHKNVIIKPVDGHGGRSVFYLKERDPNCQVVLETVSSKFTQAIIVQRYLPAARLGDKRILLLDGEPLGAVLRVHAQGEHRNNFFAGGKPQKAQITKRDRQIISELKPHLQKLKLGFVGLDIIGEYLTEVNVTSPTCLQEINRLNDQHLEDKVIDWLVNKIESRQKESSDV